MLKPYPWAFGNDEGLRMVTGGRPFGCTQCTKGNQMKGEGNRARTPLLLDITSAGIFTQTGNSMGRICPICVMDNTDPGFRLLGAIGCSHCVRARSRGREFLALGKGPIDLMVSSLHRSSRPSGYDSIIGVSGGIDSSVCMEWAAEHELRPLIVHVDAGWNTEAAVRNVETLCTAFGFDLETVVIDWEQMRGLQVAFLRSGVANQDIPQDHVFFAALYATALKFDIKNVIEGRNWQTEIILPTAWGHSARDTVHLRAVARLFGEAPIDRLPIMPEWRQRVLAPWFKGMRVLTPLHYLPYDKADAKQRLIERYGWVDYGGKHHESRWTRFFQNFYLPHRFGFDKRKAHLSSLICSGQMTREAALAELEKPLYDPGELAVDRDFVVRKLGLTLEDFDSIVRGPLRMHTDLPHSRFWDRARVAVGVTRKVSASFVRGSAPTAGR